MIRCIISFHPDIHDSDDPENLCIELKQSDFGPYKGQLDRMYDFIIENGCDHDTAASVTSWAELASVGETYKTDQFIAEIFDDE